jgi:hypothetical protein
LVGLGVGVGGTAVGIGVFVGCGVGVAGFAIWEKLHPNKTNKKATEIMSQVGLFI